jgi:hypothetical protein
MTISMCKSGILLEQSIDIIEEVEKNQSMKRLKSLFVLSCLSCATTFVPYKSEWKQSPSGDVFYAGISASASEKATQIDSVSMKQRTCIDATKTISTSPKISQLLVDAEQQEISASEVKELGKLIASYKITPNLIECQPKSKDSFFGGVDWSNCQCLYSVVYPGGRAQLQKNILKVK